MAVAALQDVRLAAMTAFDGRPAADGSCAVLLLHLDRLEHNARLLFDA